MDKELIYDEESERAVLGCCLEEDKNIPIMLRILQPDMFYYKKHQLIYKAIRTIYSQEHTGDVMLIARYIKSQDQVNRIGGLPYLYDLLESAIDTSNVQYYADIVKENYTRRRLVKLGQQYKDMAYKTEQPITDIIDSATESLTELTVQPAKDSYLPVIMDNTFETLLESKKKMEAGETVSTLDLGFDELDMHQTVNQRGTMLTLTGDSGTGKSIMLRNVMANRFGQGLKTLMFTTEISQTMTSLSFYSILTGIKFDVLNNAFMAQKKGLLSDKQWAKIKKVHSTVDELKSWVESGNVTIEYIKNRARELQMSKGFDCLVVDYIQNIYASKSFQSRPLELDYIVNQLAGLAEELNIHVTIVSQLSMKDRKMKSKNDPLSGEGAWSSGVRNNSSCLIQLRSTLLDPRCATDSTHQTDTGVMELMELRVLKDRYAESPASYGIVFEKQCHTMYSTTPEEKDYFFTNWLDINIDFEPK